MIFGFPARAVVWFLYAAAQVAIFASPYYPDSPARWWAAGQGALLGAAVVALGVRRHPEPDPKDSDDGPGGSDGG